MSDSLSSPRSGFLSRSWHDRVAWNRAADILVVMVAVFLPWSTSLVAIAIVLWLFALIPTLDARRLRKTFARPECAIPTALFLLAVIGTLWATDVPWAARLHGINPIAKLLVIPLLIYHFETSSRGMWVITGFLVSCTTLMLLSWCLYFTGVTIAERSLGVPVKDYIAQSQEFALCAFGAGGVALLLFRQQKEIAGYVLASLAVVFVANMVFVSSSRTVLVCIPVLIAVLGFKFFGLRGVVFGALALCLLAACAWAASPALRLRVDSVAIEYNRYKQENAITSTGQRLEYLKKSIRFLKSAPLFGHGTGSLRMLFDRDAVGQTGVSADVVNNPHNQTASMMVQWGALGGLLLYAMWLLHLRLFQDMNSAAWIGLVAVVENVVSSLFNSHISDFVQGWIYVVAVGVAAGIVHRDKLVHARIRAQGVHS